MQDRRCIRCTVVMLVIIGCTEVARGDLFDQARQAMQIRSGQLDMSGVSVRGGANLQTGQRSNSQTLLRAQASVGGPCGSFDFGASLQQAFEEIPEMFATLVSAIITNLPMTVLCYSSPTLCDLAKHYQALINLTIQARYGQCQQVQTAMAYAGMRLRGGNTSQCLEDQVNNGSTLSEALRTCNGGVSSIRAPDGSNRSQVEIIGETLQAAGASQETQALAADLLGSVTINTNDGRLGARHDRRSGAMLRRYEGHQAVSRTALDAALAELQQTGSVSEATLRQVSVPGQPIPRAALEALLTLRNDAVRYESMAGKLTTGLAITRLTWECGQLQEELAAATEGNSHLTDEERRILEKRVESIERELRAIMLKKDVIEKHLQPAMDALLTEYQAVRQVATEAGLRAPSRQPRTTPYRGQMPLGYSQ